MAKQIKRAVSVGSSIGFSCYGDVVWSYNGGELPLTVDLYFINADNLVNSIIHINDVRMEDAGTYTCSGHDAITLHVLGKWLLCYLLWKSYNVVSSLNIINSEFYFFPHISSFLNEAANLRFKNNILKIKINNQH